MSTNQTERTALVTGATGYIGARLVPALLGAGFTVRVLVRDIDRIRDRSWFATDNPRLQVVEGDATDTDALVKALTGVDVGYYLLHSMDGQGDFVERDRAMVTAVTRVADEQQVGRLVYLSGLHPEGELSEHLESRVEVGRIMLEAATPAVILQAAVILGSGSASFEMLRHLTRRLPVMVTPRWVHSTIQPIGVQDVLHYLLGAADLAEADLNRSYDIGGPDVLTYLQMIQRFAELDGRQRRLVGAVPVLTPGLASHWVGLVTPVPTGVAKPLVGSLVHDVVCQENDLQRLLPHRDGLLGFDDAVRAALSQGEVALDQRPEPGEVDPAWVTSADPPWAG